LILKPDGNGKLSKRDGDRLGFPVFAMEWKDPNTGEVMKGFKELGFLKEAFVNMLAVLGWNDGTEKEIFPLEELVEKFSIERVHSSGAKFDYEKAKWFNHEWIKKLEVENWQTVVKKIFEERGITIEDEAKFKKVLVLIKDRCTLLTDFWEQGNFFFSRPTVIDTASILSKWNEHKNLFFNELLRTWRLTDLWDAVALENAFKEIAAINQLKPGELMLPLRIMLVGGKYGPGVFDIATLLNKEETLERIAHALSLLNEVSPK